MKPEQENKWREEFESAFANKDVLIMDNGGNYYHHEVQDNFNTYLEARKKAQEEIDEMTKDKDRIHAHRAKLIEEITQLKEELKSERFFSSKFELQAMRGFPTGKEWYYLVKEHLKIQKQRRVEL